MRTDRRTVVLSLRGQRYRQHDDRRDRDYDSRYLLCLSVPSLTGPLQRVGKIATAHQLRGTEIRCGYTSGCTSGRRKESEIVMLRMPSGPGRVSDSVSGPYCTVHWHCVLDTQESPRRHAIFRKRASEGIIPPMHGEFVARGGGGG
jgi:hypothetical protein